MQTNFETIFFLEFGEMKVAVEDGGKIVEKLGIGSPRY